jgi:hypothetical protein
MQEWRECAVARPWQFSFLRLVLDIGLVVTAFRSFVSAERAWFLRNPMDEMGKGDGKAVVASAGLRRRK